MWFPKRLYSQNFEDLYLSRLFSDVDKGFYVDVGAWHPSNDSVTKIFYEQGWRGINIEPLKEAFDLLVEDRAGDFNLNLAISDHLSRGKASLAVLGDNPLLNGQHALIESAEQESLSKYPSAKYRSVSCTNLRDVFEKYVINTKIHFLKIDTQGLEFQALQGLRLEDLPERLFPLVILYNSTLPETRLSSLCRRDCAAYLESNGYKYLFFDGLNDYYCKDICYETYSSKMQPPNVFDRPSVTCRSYFEASAKASDYQHRQVEADQEIYVLQQQLLDLQRELKKSLIANDELQEEAELFKLMVHQGQEEMEAICKQLEAAKIESTLKTEEAELAFRQVHKIQETLEKFMTLFKKQSKVMAESEALKERLSALLAAAVQ